MCNYRATSALYFLIHGLIMCLESGRILLFVQSQPTWPEKMCLSIFRMASQSTTSRNVFVSHWLRLNEYTLYSNSNIQSSKRPLFLCNFTFILSAHLTHLAMCGADERKTTVAPCTDEKVFWVQLYMLFMLIDYVFGGNGTLHSKW